MQQPLISIGILCYNAEETIGRAIESALAQEWENKEILVVDDGSVDQSVAMVEKIAANESCIRLIKHAHNKGRPAARNTVLNNFQGEYLAFFDDDDWSLPSRLHAQYQRLIDFHEPFTLCFCHLEEILPNKQLPHRIIKGIGWHAPEPHGEMVAKYYLRREKDPNYCWGVVGTCAFMAHKSTIKRIGQFDVAMLRSQDVDYVIRAGLQGGHLISVDKALVKYYKMSSKDKSAFVQMKSQLHLACKYKEHISQYQFLMRTAKPPIRKALKEELHAGEYLQLIWNVTKVSPSAGLKLFFRPKNILRLLRLPFVKLVKK